MAQLFKARNHPQQVKKRGAIDKVDDRETPLSIFDPLNEEFHFHLDAAASAMNAKCLFYFDIEENSLERPWVTTGAVWCNPPYSDLRSWVKKAIDEVELGHCNRVVMLLPANRTEQNWWHELVENRRDGRFKTPHLTEVRIETRFLRGRAKFATPENPGARYKTSAPFGLVVLVISR